MSEEGMQKVASDDLIPEVKNVHLDKCEMFLVRKQNITSFQPGTPMRRKAPLELIHTDVCYMDTK